MLIVDFHIHSGYARWCSKKLTVENIWKTCIVKWIDIVWTGDFTHPQWFEELQKYLEEDDSWFLIPKKEFLDKRTNDIQNFVNQEVFEKIKNWSYPRFVLQTEINSVFQRQKDKNWKFTIKLQTDKSSKDIKKARIHNVILVDWFENWKRILDYLSKFGKVESDWRLAVRHDQADTLFWLKQNISSVIFFPAHIWTPYFGVLGSKFWFSSLKEAFLDSYFLVDWVETGLSSDPIMNWINPEIDPFVIVSNSDAHSLENLGREGNVIKYHRQSENQSHTIIESKRFSYKDLEKIFKFRKYKYFRNELLGFEREYLDELFKEENKFELAYTIEFYPQEGKYFGDWHWKCEFSCTPQETIQRNWKCPICWKSLIIWVFHRCFDLWDKDRENQIWFGNKYSWSADEINQIAQKFNRPGYKYFVPLRDVIYEVWWKKKWTKWAEKIYNDLILKFWSEFYILLFLPLEKAYEYDSKFWLALEKIRNNNIYIKSWYDWIYWVVKIFETDEEKSKVWELKFRQDSLF